MNKIPHKRPTKTYDADSIRDFVTESNKIEQEYSAQAIEDSIKAWDRLTCYGSMSIELLLATHKIVMANLRPDIAGKFRDCDVYIGGRRCIFVSEALIKEDVQKVIDKMNKSIKNPPKTVEGKEKIVKECHVELNIVHGFEDGNGRVSRLLMNWHRYHLTLPLHIIHAGKEQYEYYRWWS